MEHHLSPDAYDEQAIYNHPEFWKDLPVTDGAVEAIEKIRGALGFKLFLFARRPWPDPARFPAGQEEEYRRKWWWENLSAWSPLGPGALRALTKWWLKRHGITYDKLNVDRNSTDSRFALAQKHGVRIFVESDVINAIKLASICEVVFLYTQHYNQSGQRLPRNVIRVSSWKEIYEFISRKM